MVEQSDSGASKPEETPEVTATNPAAAEAEEEVVDTKWGLEPAPPLDAEGEKSLAEFLSKVQTACSNDKSVPDFVGLQVGEWLKEMDAEKKAGETGAPQTGEDKPDAVANEEQKKD